MITWISETMGRRSDGFQIVQLKPVPLSGNQLGFIRFNKAKRLCHGAVIGAALIGLTIAASVVDGAAASGQPRKTVAAGLGYQDADSSSITVKTYDAETGEVLSDETYELDIKDDGPPSSQPRDRIFAGGVGSGQEGLSEFTLRVYDAATGRFLWEGRLNLGVGIDPNVAAYPVVAHLQPRAALLRISDRNRTIGQPYYVLRAVNPETGQLVWADQFSTDAANVRVERIGRSVIGMAGVVPPEIDFRIKMPDEAGRQWLWEDKIVPSGDEEAARPERSDDNAHILPIFPHSGDGNQGMGGV
jgi:hypothetical protein